MMYTLCLFTQLDPGFGVTFSVVKGVLPSVARCRIPEIVVIHMVNSSRMLSNIPCKFIIDFIESLYKYIVRTKFDLNPKRERIQAHVAQTINL